MYDESNLTKEAFITELNKYPNICVFISHFNKKPKTKALTSSIQEANYHFWSIKKMRKKTLSPNWEELSGKLANIGKKEYKTFQFYALKKKNILVKKEWEAKKQLRLFS